MRSAFRMQARSVIFSPQLLHPKAKLLNRKLEALWQSTVRWELRTDDTGEDHNGMAEQSTTQELVWRRYTKMREE